MYWSQAPGGAVSLHAPEMSGGVTWGTQGLTGKLGSRGAGFLDSKCKQLLQMFTNVKRLIPRSGEPCRI